MRWIGAALVGVALLAGAGEARAEDWRAMDTSNHEVVFVDADSVRRRDDGRIAFRARHRVAENPSNRDFGYDRIDVAVSGRCGPDMADGPPASSRRSYFLRGRPVAAPDWREEDVAEDIGWIAIMVCRGTIGHRSFADLDAAMAEYAGHDTLERLAAYVSPEVELTGTVVQGFEMNAVSLCGSEAGCSDGAASEYCWLEGNISVPAPAGAPDWVGGGPRRDSADLAFRGRIHRSRTRGGFGHMGGYSCLVEPTGPARPAEIVRQERTDPIALGRRPETVAAHAALSEAVAGHGRIEYSAGLRRWAVDELQAADSANEGGGACYSRPRFGGDFLEYGAPWIGWAEVRGIERRGGAVTLVSAGYDETLEFYLPTPAAAQETAAFARRLLAAPVAAIAQQGPMVTLRHSDGRRERLRFADSAGAIQAAGIASRLRGADIAEIRRQGILVWAAPLRRIALAFTGEAQALAVLPLMEALQAACRVPAVP
ncbi:MAG: hypothetical protein QOI38_1360 [Sphingomonadales bacterium]|jgi:hypothetical protein|nr:hypothetical protein [Sphingomonadales bacterium]